jgi:glyoxylase-like metal-dependent hydrolase (beta-lactamase superfamily II)
LIVPLHAANPGDMTGTGNWTYWLPGRFPVLIDAGVGAPSHIAAIEAARREGPGHVLVSHAHGDHINGTASLVARWPETSFSKFPWPERDGKHPVRWRTLADGALIPAGDDELQAIHTPGHAPDHLAFWHAASRTVFSGDLVVRGSTVVIPASMGGSLAHYLQSLDRLLRLQPARLLPAHGPAIDDPEALIRQYLQHRRQREQQVRAALQDGLRTVDALVERIYVGLAPALTAMARESVLAHLLKLQDEDAVRRDGDEWTLY